MVNYANINLTPLELNLTNITDTTNILQNSASAADSATNGWFAIVSLFIMWIFLVYELYKDDGVIRLDFLRANIFASGVVFIMGSILVVNELITTLVPVIWFGFILLGSLIAMYFVRLRGG